MMVDMAQKERIYREYASKVRGYIAGKLFHGNDVEDLTQTVFLKIYAKLDVFDPTRASLSTWIYTVTKNTVIDYFRTQKHEDVLCELDGAPEYEDDDAGLDLESDMLIEGLAALPQRERDVILFHYYEGMTLKQAAELMGMSYSNIKLVHGKAIDLLKGFFGVSANETKTI